MLNNIIMVGALGVMIALLLIVGDLWLDEYWKATHNYRKEIKK